MNYERNKKLMYRRDRWHCRNCNTTQNLTPHHIVFQSQGGDDSLDNLVTLCIACHTAVHDGKLEVIIDETVSKDESPWWRLEFKRKRGWKP